MTQAKTRWACNNHLLRLKDDYDDAAAAVAVHADDIDYAPCRERQDGKEQRTIE